MFIDFSSSTADFIKECNIAKNFDHPNVLSLIGVCIIPEEAVPLMVMPNHFLNQRELIMSISKKFHW